MAQQTLSLEGQADLLQRLYDATFMASGDGSARADAYLYISPEDGDQIGLIISRLRKMAPHERAIRMIVTAR